MCGLLYSFYLVYVCIYYELLVSLGTLPYLLLFAWVLTVLTLSILNGITQWGKSYYCLSCVYPEPFQSVTYSSWPGPFCIFCGAWAALHDHVYWCAISSDTAQFAIRHNMSGFSFLALLVGSNRITCLPLVTMWCAMIIFFLPGNIWCMHLLASWIWVK